MGLDQLWVHTDPDITLSEDTDGEIFQTHKPSLRNFHGKQIQRN